MPTETAVHFRSDLAGIRQALLSVNPSLAAVPWRAGGWSRKQILGHLLDSAANNRQRFVRAALDGSYNGPGYAQDSWVDLHGYAEQSWETLLRWWQAEHEILVELVDRIPEERLAASCVIAGGDPVTLQFVIDDYVAHQKHHLEQIKTA
jgi:hypothetical protein